MLQFSFSKVSDKEILARTDFHVRSERKHMHVLLWHFNEIELRKLYLKKDCTSLFDFLTKHCGYSDSSASERMNATRLLRKAPEISTYLETNEINLTQMARIESALKECRKLGKLTSEIDEKASAVKMAAKVKKLNLSETIRILAKELDLPIKKHQKKTPQKDDSVRIEFTMTKEQFDIFQQAQNLVSHSVPNRDLAESVAYLSQYLINKKTGKKSPKEEKFKKAQEPAETKNQAPFSSAPMPEVNSNGKNRTRASIPQKTQRELMKTANFQCEFKSPVTGQRCESRHQLQIDHRVPWSLNGDDSIENLRVLCAVHNRAEAERWGLRKKP